jgi:hypothetical protein
MQLTIEGVFKDGPALCEETASGVRLGSKVGRLALYIEGGSALYGFTMGLNHSLEQACVSALKVPILFLATLCICLPTLHFIGLLFGSTMRFAQSLVILLSGIALTSILLAAFAPISLLFLASGSDYPFLLLMHVIIFAFCGAAGLVTINKHFTAIRARTGTEGANVISNQVLKVWMLLYMFVGAQTAFILSPFVGRGSFLLFNRSQGNFYSYLLSVILELLHRSP